MKIKYLVLAFVLVVLVFSTVASTAANKENKVRVIAHTDKEINDALNNGCTVVREARTLKALVCSEDAALSLGLQEDIKVFALDDVSEKGNDRFSTQDTNANKQIKADLVQSSGNSGAGRNVVVLDTGYNYNHPELSSSYLGGTDFVNDDNDPFDDNGHGSHVAGIITGDGVDAKAKGVAPAAGIIAGKVLSGSGSGYFSDVVAAIYWAVDNNTGVDAISMSLGTSQPYTYKGFCDNVLPDLTNAIKYARSKGVTVAVAAGNSGSAGVSIPGCISYSTTVGAVDSVDKIASFSGKGNAVDITAPGVSIYSSVLGTGYASWSGTSMATPMVAGVVALVRSAHPAYTVVQTENALFKTAKDLGKAGKDTSYGWGRVDALGAVNYAS